MVKSNQLFGCPGYSFSLLQSNILMTFLQSNEHSCELCSPGLVEVNFCLVNEPFLWIPNDGLQLFLLLINSLLSLCKLLQKLLHVWKAVHFSCACTCNCMQIVMKWIMFAIFALTKVETHLRIHEQILDWPVSHICWVAPSDEKRSI